MTALSTPHKSPGKSENQSETGVLIECLVSWVAFNSLSDASV